MRLPIVITFCASLIMFAFSAVGGRHLLEKKPRSLVVEAILAWRLPFDDLIGKETRIAAERFGEPDFAIPGWIGYLGSAKTGFRKIDMMIEGGKIIGVKVFARPQDTLEVEQVIQRAPIFCFSSGTYTDSTQRYMNAQSADGRNALQFSLGQNSVSFHAVLFKNDGQRCDPTAIASSDR
jgi:hypothetical protein